jgi:uncharacterized protein (DUF2147 family)
MVVLVVGVLLSSIAMSHPALAQSSILGNWQPPERDSIVEIYVCEDKVCGRVVELDEPLDDDGNPKTDISNRDKALRSRPILGMELLAGFTMKEPGDYREGQIYNPRDGKLYKAVLTVRKDGTLKVRGYVGVPALGKTQIWVRSED